MDQLSNFLKKKLSQNSQQSGMEQPKHCQQQAIQQIQVRDDDDIGIIGSKEEADKREHMEISVSGETVIEQMPAKGRKDTSNQADMYWPVQVNAGQGQISFWILSVWTVYSKCCST